jgi:peptidoglycan/LPS O-acetylase OafA/YrhL
LAVFLFHYFNIHLLVDAGLSSVWPARLFKDGGYLGVDFFFTLSGFLITTILITKPVDLAQFYSRRLLRIVPLYFLIVFVSYGLLPLVQSRINLPPLLPLLTFTANYYYAYHGDAYLFAITLLWSLSVEMQFYLVWGALLRWLSPYLYWIAGGLIVASLMLKYAQAGHNSLYYITETYVPDFMIGAIGAKLLSGRKPIMDSISKLMRLSGYAAVIVIFICLHWLNHFFWWKLAGNLLLALPVIMVIADQMSGASLFDLGRSGVLSRLGRISYGIYCFQGFVLPLYSKFVLPHLINMPAWLHWLPVPLVLFAITCLLAEGSYRYFESYFLRQSHSK